MKLLVFTHIPPPHHGQMLSGAAHVGGFRHGPADSDRATLSPIAMTFLSNSFAAADVRRLC
jgi:hypothetical protein